uniref:GH116 family glycosyl hydrolase n=1 Tax=uncultured Draconibacterium sp. TaxID=1573823 RepID=UPI003217BD70
MTSIKNTCAIIAVFMQLSFLSFGQVSINNFFSNPSREPSYEIISEKAVYQGNWEGCKHENWPPKDEWWNVYLQMEQGFDLPKAGPWCLNYVVRQDPSWFVSGDLPRFSLVQTGRTTELNPHFNMYGDVRIRYTIDNNEFWLDEKGKTTVTFFPWGTIHKVELAEEGLEFNVEALILGNNAIGLTVTATASEYISSDIQFSVTVGGADLKFINFFPPYFTVSPEDEQNDDLKLVGNQVYLKNPENISGAYAECKGCDNVNVIRNGNDIKLRAFFSKKINKNKATMQFLLKEEVSQIDIESFDDESTATKKYYDQLLADYEIETPDEILNTGFYSSILNMEYTYASPGWLEGIHQWNSYFSDNYQISAAIGLGQLGRAKDALLFFGDRPEGPGYVFNADGTYTGTSELGLPYYVLQLWRYWKATGDDETLEKVWEGTQRNFKRMLEVRDPDGNGLLNWQFGCNAFLYQSDHLQLLGDAASPSLMLCGLFEMMADMAEEQNDSGNASFYKNRVEHLRSLILRKLWLSDEGRFSATVTQDGKAQKASYYTDYAFPQLYSGLPAEYNWLALQACDSQIWIGDHLMRMGNYKPDLFGNNAVGGTQMCEAAEAYFSAGLTEKGWALLHGTALGSTIYTDSPGSFPENLSTTGWGLNSFGFGNSAGSYIRSVISGLFGIERRSVDGPLFWRPAIPREWRRARLRVKDIEVSVTSIGHQYRYEFITPQKQELICRIPIEGRIVKSVTADGKQIAYNILANSVGGELEVRLEPSKIHAFEVSYEKEIINWIPPAVTANQNYVSWTLPKEGYAIKDPEHVFRFFKIEGQLLNGTLQKHTGKKVFFLSDKNGMIPCEVDFGEEINKTTEQVSLKGERKNISMNDKFNSDFIWGKNFWRLIPHEFDFTALLSDVKDGFGQLKVGDNSFLVKANGQNMLTLEVGTSDGYTCRQNISQWPEQTEFEIEEKIKGLDFLFASDCQVRLTGMQVGSIKLHYKDGFIECVPLVFGDNIDCMKLPFASNVSVLKVEFAQYVYSFSVRGDSSRVLEKLAIELSAIDANIGIFGLNLVKTDDEK